MTATLVGYLAPIALITFCSVLLCYYVVHSFLTSPLAKVPNAHWTSPFVPWWILWKRYREEELAAAYQAHQRLGPIVRLGPRDLSVSSYENGIRTIYGGGFDKPAYFDFFNYYGSGMLPTSYVTINEADCGYRRTNSFCSLTRKEHSIHRRRVSLVYTKSALFSSAQLSSLTKHIVLGRLVPKLDEQASKHQPVEMLTLTYALCLDYVNAFIFGYSSGPNFLQDESGTQLWLEHYEQRYCKESFWPQELPTITKWLNALGVDLLPKEHLPSKYYLERWMMCLCEKANEARSLADQGLLKDPGDIPVVYQQVQKSAEADMKGADELTKKLEVASELFDHMSGAREVLGLVLSYTLYYISQNQQAQDRLRGELASAGLSITMTDSDPNPTIPPPASLDGLPYLTAVLNESFRMRPNSTPLPRITPRDQAVSLAGIDNIPPGTRINSFQWFVHRDPRLWDRPDSWIPERWLRGEKAGVEDKGVLWPFGSGPRMCLGSHLTQYMMRYVIAVIYSNYRTVAVDDGDFGKHPPGSLDDRLMVRFERLDI